MTRAAPACDAGGARWALAHGAPRGARGNSGVILSRILRGRATGLADHRNATGATLAAAFPSASDAAYAALAEPKEGTNPPVTRAASGAPHVSVTWRGVGL